MNINTEKERRLDHAYLTEYLDYCAQTGAFTWKKAKRGRKVGQVAGNIISSGYLRLTINYETYLCHRLAIFYVTGEWPTTDVDHINQIRTDNRWENLRVVSRAFNCAHKVTYNQLGIKGVYKSGRRFAARIWDGTRNISLGVFDTPEEASLAYNDHHAKIQGDRLSAIPRNR